MILEWTERRNKQRREEKGGNREREGYRTKGRKKERGRRC